MSLTAYEVTAASVCACVCACVCVCVFKPEGNMSLHRVQNFFQGVVLQICASVFCPGPFSTVWPPNAFTVRLTLMWEGNQLMWSQTLPKAHPPALP